MSGVHASPGNPCKIPSDLETSGGSGVLFGVAGGCDGTAVNAWRSWSSSGVTIGAGSKITTGLSKTATKTYRCWLLRCVQV